MRRRDAQRTYLPTLGRRPNGLIGVSVIVSVGLHLAVLALATAVTVRTSPIPHLVPIALLPGSGAGKTTNGGGSDHPESRRPAPAAQAEPPAAAPSAPAPPAPAVDPEASERAIPRAPTRPRQRREQPRTTLAAAVTEAATRSAAVVHELAAAAERSDSAPASDPAPASGTGISAGPGSGTGAGSGSDGGDTRAHCVYCPEPRYPMIARQRGWEGTVRVSLAVGRDGNVQTASLRQSSGHGTLDEAAVAVARRSRFTPPETSGLPTPLFGHIEYRFQLSQAPWSTAQKEENAR